MMHRSLSSPRLRSVCSSSRVAEVLGCARAKGVSLKTPTVKHSAFVDV